MLWIRKKMLGDRSVLMFLFCLLQQVYCLGSSNNGSNSGDGEWRHVFVIFFYWCDKERSNWLDSINNH